jgi:Spy/CpxP family protein refolding chaperone
MKTTIVLGALLPVLAAAQEGDDPHARVREQWRMMRMWKLTEALSLDEATGSKLFPLLNKYDDQEDAVHRDMRDADQALRAALNSGKDTRKLTELVDRMIKNQDRIGQIRMERIREARKLLSPVQQAKLALLMPRIERHFQRMIEKVMRGRGPGGPGPGGRGPGPGGPPAFDDDDDF